MISCHPLHELVPEPINIYYIDLMIGKEIGSVSFQSVKNIRQVIR